MKRAVSILTLAALIAAPLAITTTAVTSAKADQVESLKKKKKNQIKKKLDDIGLSGIGVLDVAKANNKKKKSSKLGIYAATSSAPTLSQLGSSNSLSEIFWNPEDDVIGGLLSGTPTDNQCNQFFSGQNDGDSGGISACQMAQGVGFAFQPVVQAGTSLCYMRSFPSQANLDAGAVEVISGELPDGDIEKIFAPGDEPRIVHVAVSGFSGESEEGGGPEDIYISVPSNAENAANNLVYEVTLNFCSSGANPSGRENIKITKSSRMIHRSQGDDEQGKHEALVEAAMMLSGGEIVVDPAIKRSASINFASDSSTFKSDIEVTANNLLKVKTSDTYENTSRKAFSISEFSGNNIGELRFKRGALKDESDFGDAGSNEFNGATSWNGSFYQFDDSSNLKSQLNSVNFNNDSFYDSLTPPDPDLADFSCDDVEADIEVSIDMSNPAMEEVASKCEARIQNMDFCRSGEISDAEQAFFENCGFDGAPEE